MSTRFDTIHERSGQTNGQTPHNGIGALYKKNDRKINRSLNTFYLFSVNENHAYSFSSLYLMYELTWICKWVWKNDIKYDPEIYVSESEKAFEWDIASPCQLGVTVPSDRGHIVHRGDWAFMAAVVDYLVTSVDSIRATVLFLAWLATRLSVCLCARQQTKKWFWRRFLYSKVRVFV